MTKAKANVKKQTVSEDKRELIVERIEAKKRAEQLTENGLLYQILRTRLNENIEVLTTTNVDKPYEMARLRGAIDAIKDIDKTILGLVERGKKAEKELKQLNKEKK